MDISSTSKVKILPYRRIGNTTRIIDNAIQLLFQGHTVRVEDHFQDRHAQKRVYDAICKRLNSEHPGVNAVYNNINMSIYLDSRSAASEILINELNDKNKKTFDKLSNLESEIYNNLDEINFYKSALLDGKGLTMTAVDRLNTLGKIHKQLVSTVERLEIEKEPSPEEIELAKDELLRLLKEDQPLNRLRKKLSHIKRCIVDFINPIDHRYPYRKRDRKW